MKCPNACIRNRMAIFLLHLNLNQSIALLFWYEICSRRFLACTTIEISLSDVFPLHCQQFLTVQMPFYRRTEGFPFSASVCRAVNRLNVAIIGAFSGADWSYFTSLKVYNKRVHCWVPSWFMALVSWNHFDIPIPKKWVFPI